MLRLIATMTVLLADVGLMSADELRFRRHDVDLESTFPAAAAIDVNEDGLLDIVCGGWWYEAPEWTRHFLQVVPEIRGRYDDYSNLPLDVNGDGRLDIVSANYRSESIRWIENPGPDGGEWKAFVVDTPGPMETGRLEDIDDDGLLDVLPAGKDFAAWWSVDRTSGRWTRHDLPAQLAGHGIGFGDIDGDGRSDLVGVTGWAKAPADRDHDQWIWNDDFRLHRDASIPTLVHDVDGDGDADLIWGRGHKTGLYWMEQTDDDWTQHAIDTEFSQLHSLLLADLDNNGQEELIVGKRYLGHDGKDVGEYDPMVVAAYSFDKDRRSWRRSILDQGTRAGFDLDPKAVDLDADGDVDLLCPTRGGLCWLENLHVGATKQVSAPVAASIAVARVDHTDLTTYLDGAMLRPIETPDDWGRRRSAILSNMQAAMGPLPSPEERVPLEFTLGEPEADDDCERRHVTIDIGRGEQITAWLMVPKERTERMPAMLCLHQTIGVGKDEPAGLGGQRTLHYARDLVKRGYVCLVPDYPTFGEDHYDFEAHTDRWQSGSMKAIWNNLRCVDFLESLPEVDPDRIGVIGHSLGGHNALFTAAFDQRLAAVVTSCGFTAFHSYYGGDLNGWTSLRYMPRIKTLYGNDPDRVPFDFYEVLAAIAPRPIFVNAPLHDSNFDNDGVDKVVDAAGPVYERLRSKNWQGVKLETPDSAHDFPDAVRVQAYDWLDDVLK